MAVWFTQGLFGLLLVFHSYLSPIGAPPDEHMHFDMAMLIAEGDPYPSYDGRMGSRGALEASYRFRPAWGVRTPESVDRENFEQSLSAWGGKLDSDRVNYLAQHPPLYYEVVGEGVHASRWLRSGPGSVYREWHLLRLISIAMVMFLPLITWATVRSLGASGAAQIAAPVALLAIPQLFHVGSSINNDNLLMLLAAWLALLLSRVLAGARRWRVHALVGIAAGLALITKAFAVTFPIWIAVVYVARASHDREGRRRLAAGLGVAATGTTLVGAWWGIRNFLEYRSFAPTTEDAVYSTSLRPAGFEPDPIWYLQRFSAWMPRRFFGWFGYMDVPMSLGVAVLGASVFGISIGLAMRRIGAGQENGPLDPSGVRRRHLVALGSVAFLLIGFVLFRAYGLYTTTSRTPFIQGRYLLPALVPLVTMVGVGSSRVLRRWSPLALLGLAVLMQVDAVRVMLSAWWGEPDDSVLRGLESLVAWNPWPLGAPRAVMGLIAAALAGLVWSLIRFTRSGPGVYRIRNPGRLDRAASTSQSAS